MKYTYDTEFLDDGEQIHLISIGIVAEDGREYYAVNSTAPWVRILRSPWLIDHVVTPHLPYSLDASGGIVPDIFHKEMKSRWRIAGEVYTFLTEGLDLDAGEQAELWADHPATDHVCLYQLWGPMVGLPAGIPWRTNCLTQERESLRRASIKLGLDQDWVTSVMAGAPEQPEEYKHHALWDARWDMDFAHALGVIEKREGVGS